MDQQRRNRKSMVEIATAPRRQFRPAILAAGLFGVLFVAAILLWAYYGTALFTEMILAGLAACF
jgi:hypothetical protein